jgi:hypothetical protein
VATIRGPEAERRQRENAFISRRRASYFTLFLVSIKLSFSKCRQGFMSISEVSRIVTQKKY